MLKRKIIIYGKNRYQRDFEYIFNEYEADYYIDEKENINGVYHFSKLREEKFEEIFVIICMSLSEQHKAKDNLKGLGLQEGQHFVLMQDVFRTLDYDIYKNIADKKVVLWGTGDVAKRFVGKLPEVYPDLKLDYIVDNDINKVGTVFLGKEIITMDDLDKSEDYFFIIGIAEYKYQQLNKYLQTKAIKANYTYAAQLLFDKPSELLKRTIFDDRQYKMPICSKMNDLRILSNGYITPCCMCSKINLGNIFCNSISEVWDSIYEKIFRLSVLNRTYSFCDPIICPYMIQQETEESKVFNYKDVKPAKPNRMLLETDASCNIMCVSCREHIFKVENDFYEAYTNRIIENYIEGCNRMILSGNGEVFASKYAKKIIASKQSKEKKEISILTNGFALNEYNWKKYLDDYEIVNVSISIDAGTKNTYEKIRRGSNWDILNENLAYIKQRKEEGKVKFFQINYVAQKMNIHEMKEFIELGKKYKVDRVVINRLDDWGISNNWYEENSIVDEGGILIKEEYRGYFDEIKDEEIVDFNKLAFQLGRTPKEPHMW